MLFWTENLIIQPWKLVIRLKGISGFQQMYDIMVFPAIYNCCMLNKPEDEKIALQCLSKFYEYAYNELIIKITMQLW